MRAVALKEMGKKAGAYIHLAEGGETVLVTDQDRVLAELIPPRHRLVPVASKAPLADAIEKGWIQPARITAGAPPRIPVPSQDVLQDLQRDRDGR